MWSVQKVINDLDPENRGRETIYLSNTGRFIIPLKNPINSLSPADIVAMIAAAVAAIIFAPTPQQQQQPKLPQPQLLPPPESLIKNAPELNRLAAFDCEWYRDDDKKNQEMGRAGDIYAFCLVDNRGNGVKLHSNYFKDRRAFMSAILDATGQYDSLAGYDMFSNEYKNFYSDIDHIKWNCNSNFHFRYKRQVGNGIYFLRRL